MTPEKQKRPPSQKSLELNQMRNLDWMDAELIIKCPNCGNFVKTKARHCYEGKRTCEECGRRSQRKLWKVQGEEMPQIYRKGWGDFLFSHKGRMNRKQFFGVWFFVGVVPALLLALLINQASSVIYFFLFFVFLGMPSSAKRMQDVGYSGEIVWTGLLFTLIGWMTFIPPILSFVGFWGLFSLFVAFRKGARDTNRFGPPTDRIVMRS